VTRGAVESYSFPSPIHTTRDHQSPEELLAVGSRGGFRTSRPAVPIADRSSDSAGGWWWSCRRESFTEKRTLGESLPFSRRFNVVGGRYIGRMHAEISLYGSLRDETDDKVVTIEVRDDATIHNALDELVSEFPGLEEQLFETENTVNEQIVVAKNNRSIEELDGLETLLEDGDSIRLSPPVVGGHS
jgi:molybdopterin synthase sulfur carrier subunit